MSFLSLENISKTFGCDEGAVHALDDISISIGLGEFVAVMGESGAGKSTLLSVMGAMSTPTRGRYLVDGIDVYALSSEKQADFRREYLGFVFQSFHLVPYLTVLENVLLPIATIHAPRREKENLALEALSRVGLADKAGRLPECISGGERERAALARAIVNNPPVLLADEPTGNLDSGNTAAVMNLLQCLNAGGTTIVMVTHSASCAAYAGKTLQVMDGRLAKDQGGGPGAASA